ncbi:uncharacterized protein APUU_20192A [Aspergillus puulaauensis]|uniref:Uncharacterized protein n=1 Tax=Aspergillus puulaauensis TaxID=1220207 RepID=A0A7R7XEB7_9EURO|nr:uncharacterized protein APUU_20192A [Aspergillus puulaauensis]BCS19760.1 hypothetical protein APUU_20192A [Aspergillus puulaauensis]
MAKPKTETMTTTAAQDIIQSITLVNRESESGDYAPALHPWSSSIPAVGHCAHGIRADRDGRLSHLWGSVMGLGTVLDRFVVVQPDEKEIFIFADNPAP